MMIPGEGSLFLLGSSVVTSLHSTLNVSNTLGIVYYSLYGIPGEGSLFLLDKGYRLLYILP